MSDRFAFTENPNRLNHSVIELLQDALSTQFELPEINQLSSKYLTQVIPNPSNVQLSQNQQMILFLYFKPEILGRNIYFQQVEDNSPFKFNVKCLQEGVENSTAIAQDCEIKLDACIAGNNRQIMGLNQMLNHLFLNILSQEFKFHYIAKDTTTLRFYDIIKMCDRHQFLNPLTCLVIGEKLIFQNINLDKLANLSEQYEKQKSFTSQVQNIFSSLFTQSFEQQIVRLSSGKKENKNYKPLTMMSNQSSSKEDQEYLMSLIMLQYPDGSFPIGETMKLLSPVITPINSLNSPNSTRIKEDYDLSSGRKNLQLPQFLMEKVWATALAIAFLKKYYRRERGQWLLICVKSLQYLKQYVNNTRILLLQAKKAIQLLEPESQYQF